MTDSRTMLGQIVSQTQAFISAFEAIELMADRINADSTLSAALAAAAANSSRGDLTAANFDNFKLATQQLRTMLETPNANVPTGGEMVLAYYQIM